MSVITLLSHSLLLHPSFLVRSLTSLPLPIFSLHFLGICSYPPLLHSSAITATTGIAALNIHGGTLHSWAGIGLGKEPAFNLAKKVMNEIWDNKGKRWVKKGGIPFKENDWKETQVL